MSLLFRKGEPEERSLNFQSVWGSGTSDSMLGLRQATALSLVPVYAATGLIADQFAATPVHAYTKDPKTKIASKVDRQPDLFTDPGMTLDLYSWKHQAISSCLLRGNAYGLIVATTGSLPSKVMWLRPDEVHVDEYTDILHPKFYWRGWLIPPEQLIHIPAYVQPGSVQGLSPLALFAKQIDTGDQAQTFGQNWFRRGGIPSGVLKNNGRTLTATAAQEAKSRFKASVSAQEPFVTGNDWDYTAITIPGGESQFISTLKLTANQFAAIYRVAPEDVGGETGSTSLTYKSLEQDQIRFAMRTMRPWVKRFEAVFDKFLAPNQYTRFDLDDAARADMITRMQAQQTALNSGVVTLTEARHSEDKPPLTAQEWNDYLTYRAADKSRVPLPDPAINPGDSTAPKPVPAPIVEPTKDVPTKGGK